MTTHELEMRIEGLNELLIKLVRVSKSKEPGIGNRARVIKYVRGLVKEVSENPIEKL